MLNHSDNRFWSKFRLLNSQEPTEEISWSSSESSDYENVSKSERFCNLSNKNICQKRKRKDKVPKNISNLDVTIIDVAKEQNHSAILERSPIISGKSHKSTLFSPILSSAKYFPLFSANRETSTPTTKSLKSPILIPKYASPKVSTKKIKKKLFNNLKEESKIDYVNELRAGRKSPIFVAKTTELTQCKVKVEETTENSNDGKECDKRFTDNVKITKCEQYIDKLEPKTNSSKTMLKDGCLDCSENTSFDDCISLKTNNDTELVKKVKSFFDCHFSSENPSQHSIVETQTSAEIDTQSIEDIEIISSLTQATKSNKTSFESIISNPVSKNGSTDSLEPDFCMEKSKKIRYKKDGLGYRLNTLLKKQCANISLWQHEKYLAENSSFVIPKAEFSVFRIKKCNFKYGCYLLETINENDDTFFILINGTCLRSSNLSADCIFKLYQPYFVIDFDFKSKLIVNVCKFECVSYL